MRCLKIISCIVMIFFAAVSASGCRGGGDLIKDAIKSVGKTTKKVPNAVKRTADDVVKFAVDMATTNNTPQGSTRPTGARTSTVARAGAVMVGGALNAKDLSHQRQLSRSLRNSFL